MHHHHNMFRKRVLVDPTSSPFSLPTPTRITITATTTASITVCSNVVRCLIIVVAAVTSLTTLTTTTTVEAAAFYSVTVPYKSQHRYHYKNWASRRQGYFATTRTDSDKDTNVVAVYNTVPPVTSPLPPHTFAGMVEEALKEKFEKSSSSVTSNNSPIQRILESWRWAELGYEHKQFVPHLVAKKTSPSSSSSSDLQTLASTSNAHQFCVSYVRDLQITDFWDTTRFAWCKSLQKQYKAILQEFQQVTASAEDLKQRGNNIWAGALTTDAASYGEGWKTLVLQDRGHWDAVNANLFPVTAHALAKCGAPTTEIFFASMEPHSSIQPHSDFSNFVLTSHLPLIVPYSGQNQCRLTVGDSTREWLNGQVMLFDTSLMHDAVNESDQTRYILMLRVWHPDLTDIERQALQFIYDCLMYPDLVSSDPTLRALAERDAAATKAFPQLVSSSSSSTTSSGRVQGFGSGGSDKKKKKAKK